jgi:hypothetical protein
MHCLTLKGVASNQEILARPPNQNQTESLTEAEASIEFSTERRQRTASYAAIPGSGLLSVLPAQSDTPG